MNVLNEALYQHLGAMELSAAGLPSQRDTVLDPHGRPLILVIPDGVMIIPITGTGDIPLTDRRT